MRILVVADEADLRRQLADALTHAGYAVDLAAEVDRPLHCLVLRSNQSSTRAYNTRPDPR